MIAAVAALVLSASVPKEAITPPVMDARMRDYFAGELAESYVWAGAGLAGLAASIPLFVQDGSVGRPASVPIFCFSLVQLALGIGLYVRTPGQVERLSKQLADDPAAYAAAERTRMAGVNRGFRIYRPVELGILAIGLGLVAGGGVGRSDTAIGIGLGLIVESLLFLALDHYADERGARYEKSLLGFLGHSALR